MVNHDRLASVLSCPRCGSGMRYHPKVYSYFCEGEVLHTFRVNGQIVDLVEDSGDGRQGKVNKAFERIAGWTYEKNATGAGPFDRFMVRMMWGTTKYIPLLFELLSSVAADCDPGYFLDVPVGTGVFTAGEYSLQPNLEFVAVDYSRRMLDAALERVKAEDFGNVMLVRADVAKLPFVDGTFSGIQTMNGIGAFPDKQKSLDELVRVLKPGGKLAGSLYVKGERLLSDMLMGRIATWFGFFSRPIMTEQEFIEALSSRGIEDVVTRKVGAIMFFSGRKAPGRVAAPPLPG